ncbi:unnamed protein product [Schistosoma mattheei]|uniref:Uncharacterized protein n=1 Tax=Schistosoma mattheei TaxID=31246 RepID=A0A183PEV7_9TREM|nr:unnamed protein product [Schistosoma mattheei]
MKTSAPEGKHGIQWTARIQLDDLDFADELALLSQTEQQMQEKNTSVTAVSTAVRLSIHKGKSKILQYNTACTNPITIDGEDLEELKTFTYLGIITDEHGGSDADVKARIGKARAVYLQLKNIWNSKQLSEFSIEMSKQFYCMRRKLEKLPKPSSRRYKGLLITVVCIKYFESVGQILSATTYCEREQTRSQWRKK